MKETQAILAECYPSALVRTMYNHYLELYQTRFYVRTPTHSWEHILYWKKWMKYYAEILIKRRLLSPAEHRNNAGIIQEEQDGYKINIELRKKQIPSTNGQTDIPA